MLIFWFVLTAVYFWLCWRMMVVGKMTHPGFKEWGHFLYSSLGALVLTLPLMYRLSVTPLMGGVIGRIFFDDRLITSQIIVSLPLIISLLIVGHRLEKKIKKRDTSAAQ